MFAVSNQYVYVKEVALSYINVPENKAFHPLQLDTARVKIEATGWQLLFSSLMVEEKMIQVDLSGLRNRNYVLFSSQLGFLNRQFPENQRVVSVSPDTLYFDFSRQTEKNIPVRVPNQLSFARQFGLVGEISTNPKMVTVRGPIEDVRAITYWETDTIRLSGLNQSVSTVVSVNSKQQPNLYVYPHSLEVNIPVGEMTEKVIQIPVDVINASSYRSVKLLPGKISLTVLVSLNDFNKISADSFEAVVDMNDWQDQHIATLPVKIVRMPEYCKLIKTIPQNLDFFVNR